MKKIQFIDTFRNIQKRFISFLSICLIVALGTTGYFMTSYTGASLRVATADYYETHKFKEYEVMSSLGVTEKQIETIQALDIVKKAEGVLNLTGKLNADNFHKNVKIVSLTDEISIPEVVSGSLPTKENECAIGEEIMNEGNFKIGDTFNLSVTTATNLNPLKCETFTITAIIRHPDFLRVNDSFYLLLPMEAFDTEVTQGLYTSIYLRVKDKDTTEILDEDYISKMLDTENRLNKTASELSEDAIDFYRDRAEQIINEKWEDALRQFEEAEAKIADGESQIADGEKQIADAEAELNSTVANYRAQIADAKKQLEDAAAQLMAAESQLHQGEKAYVEAKQKYIEAGKAFENNPPEQVIEMIDTAISFLEQYEQAQTDATQEERDAIKQKINEWANSDMGQLLIKVASEKFGEDITQYVEAVKDLHGIRDLIERLFHIRTRIEQYIMAPEDLKFAENQLAAARVKIYDGWVAYHDGENELAEKEALLNQKESEGRAELAKVKDEFNTKKQEGLKQIEDGKRQLEEKRKEAEEELEKARKQLTDLDCHLVVQNRSTNYGYLDAKGTANAVEKTGLIFGILFAIVAGLVCYSTLTIIIEEEKKLVGTTKAFGFHGNEIITKYLVFGVLSSTLGVLLGIGGGYCLTRLLLWYLGKIPVYAYLTAPAIITKWPTILVGLGVILLCTIVTISACMGLLKSPASTLMKGDTVGNIKKRNRKKETKTTKKSDRSLFSRLIIRNITDDKPRVIISILIVGASCCVIGMGITIKHAFEGMIEKQLNEIAIYDGRLDYSTTISDENLAKVESLFEEYGVNYLPASYEAHLYKSAEAMDALFTLCADPERIQDFYVIRDPATQQKLTLSDDGVYAQIKLRENNDFKVGDKITLLDNTLTYHEAPYLGEFENRQGRLVVLTPKAYEKVFGKEKTDNCYYLKLDGADEAKLLKEISSISSEFSYERSDYFLTRVSAMRKIFNFVIIGMITIAIIMSFMILTNVTNIYVNRKKKELIVMRINGFSIGQVITYLARETILITIVGLIVAIILGVAISYPFNKLLEQPDAYFVRSYYPLAWVIAVAIEATFAFVISWSVFRKVKDLNFREIL